MGFRWLWLKRVLLPCLSIWQEHHLRALDRDGQGAGSAVHRGRQRRGIGLPADAYIGCRTQGGVERVGRNVSLPFPKRPDERNEMPRKLTKRLCKRKACRQPGAEWWNSSTQAWYCQPCAFVINDHSPRLCIRRPKETAAHRRERQQTADSIEG